LNGRKTLTKRRINEKRRMKIKKAKPEKFGDAKSRGYSTQPSQPDCWER
jgi:hypothetical protein